MIKSNGIIKYELEVRIHNTVSIKKKPYLKRGYHEKNSNLDNQNSKNSAPQNVKTARLIFVKRV